MAKNAILFSMMKCSLGRHILLYSSLQFHLLHLKGSIRGSLELKNYTVEKKNVVSLDIEREIILKPSSGSSGLKDYTLGK
jgi:hypothetical protein